MPCWSFSKAAVTEEEKGSVSPTTPHPQFPPAHQSVPSLLLDLLLCHAGQQLLSFFLPEAATPVQVVLFTFPACEKQETENNAAFSLPLLSNMNISPSNHCSFKSPQTLPGFLQKDRKHVWWLLNMNGRAKYFSTSVKRINQTHTAPKHPLIILDIYLCSECWC